MKILLLSLGLGRMGEFCPTTEKLGFIGTAGETYDDPYFVKEDRERLEKLGYQIDDIDISKDSTKKVCSQLDHLDGIFVAGGNSFYLLQQIVQKELMEPLRNFVLNGHYYIGASAGAAICGPSLEPFVALDDPGKAPLLESYDALDLVDIVVLPHFGKPKYLDTYQKIIDDFDSEYVTVPLKDDEAVEIGSRSEYNKVHSALVMHD